jgi:hypothetical protein
MKKTIVMALVLGLIAGLMLMPAEAKKKKVTRAATGNYVAPATAAGNCTQVDGIGCMTIQSGPKENYITAKVTDSHGQPVAIQVAADLDGDINTETVYGTFCGETTEPIKIDPGAALVFWVGRAVDAVGTQCVPGIATQGTLDVEFSNLP